MPPPAIAGFSNPAQWRCLLAGAYLALFCGIAPGQEKLTPAAPCRIAFDMGSSGIRAGTSETQKTTKQDFDAIGPLWDGKGVAAIAPATISALKSLPVQAGFGGDCARVGGGFSAWRLALQQDPLTLVETLRNIHSKSGVAVLVIPQYQEGAYAYFAAKTVLGDRFTTTYVLDIGGGSLQLAGEQQSFVAALGQQAWHRLLCERLRDTTEVPCALQPMNDRDLTRARALIAAQIADNALPSPITMTTTSRSVSRGVQPAVQRLMSRPTKRENPLKLPDVTAAIDQLAPLDLSGTAARTQAETSRVPFLFSTLILVEGLIGRAQDKMLHVAETDLNNLPGLLADKRAFIWHGHYECYLQRLMTMGIAAYSSPPESCPIRNGDR
jgi:hypothetical protein